MFAIPSDITDAQIQQVKDYFKKSPTTREGLLKRLSQEYSLSSINKLKQDKDFMQKLQTALGDKQNALDFLNEIEGNLDQRTLEDTTRDISAPKSAIDKLIASLEKKSKDYENIMLSSFGVPPPGLLYKYAAKALKAYKKVYKATGDFIKARKAWLKEFFKNFTGLNREEKQTVTKLVEKSLQKDGDFTEAKLDQLIDDIVNELEISRGLAYEEAIYRIAEKAKGEVEGFTIEGIRTEKGGAADFMAKIFGFDFNVETKLESARYSSVSFGFDPKTKKFTFSKDFSFNNKLEKKLQKAIPALMAYREGIRKIDGKAGVKLFDETGRVSTTTYNKLKKLGLQKDITQYLEMDADMIQEFYAKKKPPVYYINIKGAGLFHLGNNPLGLPVPKLDTKVRVFLGVSSTSVAGTNKTQRNFGLRVKPDQLLNANLKSDYTIDSVKGIKKLMSTPEVQLLKEKQEANNKISDMASDIVSKNEKSPKKVKRTLLQSIKARINALKINKKPKGLSAFDMDDTLALTKEKVLYTMPNGKKGELTAGEFAVQYEGLLAKGAEFDYSNFDNVDLSTEKGPLAGTALKRQGKYGPKDIYIVTARPNASQQAIKVWTDSIGLNIPIENIITLEDGSPQAKADWLLSKAEQGYNDFYFADDSALNVQTVKDILSQIDVKSRVQLAIADKANRLDQEMNDLIEDAADIGSDDIVSDVEARIEGKKRDKGFFKRILRQFKITASADDFLGLGYYLFGKGEKGTRQQKWFIENLIEPYNKAEQLLISAKITVANDFAALKKKFPSLTTKGVKSLISNPLNQEIGYKSYN